jgi:hypothetical protein
MHGVTRTSRRVRRRDEEERDVWPELETGIEEPSPTIICVCGGVDEREVRLPASEDM